MIFQHTLTNILLQNKTQTRRIIKPDETVIRGRYNKVEAVLKNNLVRNSRHKFVMVQLPEACDSKSEAFNMGYKT